MAQMFPGIHFSLDGLYDNFELRIHIEMIELQDISVVKSGHKLFEHFNLRIAKENYAIQGPNGSGKTILLELIAGMITPHAGKVTYDFITDQDWRESHNFIRDAVHYIPSHALHTFLRGHHELFYQQRYYSIGDTQIPKVKDLFGDTVDHLKTFSLPSNFNINNLLDLELIRLSNGQLKKVLILQRIAKNLPKVLLFDYPFEGLDEESRVELTHFMDHLSDSFNIQIILADHHHQLPKTITRTIILDRSYKTEIKSVQSLTAKSNKPVNANEVNNIKIPSFHHQERNKINTVVEMREVTIRYGQTTIIENLNWQITKGERWALTGKNGSGKTTLFSLIYADHPMAYSQKVFLFGRRRGTGESIWDIKRRINYLGPEQIHFINPRAIFTTARQYLTEGRHHAKDQLQDLIEFFHARDFIDKPMRHLSSGQLQLTLLIFFFLAEKELLLLDEPFQFLDPDTKARVNEYLNHYLNPEVTLILITHYDADLLTWTKLRMSL